MIVISVRFTAGRFHATPWGHHVNEGAPEWPPSPWRLLRGLIASWKLTMPEVEDDRIQRLVSYLSVPPDFHLPRGMVNHTRHYMPLYEGKRTLVLDSFIAVSPESPVYFVWKGELEQEDKTLLQSLLSNLSYFGRAESWCRAELIDACEKPNCRWVGPDEPIPANMDLVRVLAPKENATLEELMVDTLIMRNKQKRLEPPGSVWLLYARERESLSPLPRRSVAASMSSQRLTVARYAIDSVPLPLVTATVNIAELARRAIMAQYGRANDGEICPLISGRDADSKPLTGNRHAYFLPTDEDGDGRLDHLTIYIPAGLTDKVCRALANTNMLKVKDGVEIRLLLLGFCRAGDDGAGDYLLWSTTWRSATPFVMHRHPKRYRSGLAKLKADGTQVDGPEDQILREWLHRCGSDSSLPRIVRIDRLPELRSGNNRRISWLDFRCERSSYSAPSSAGIGGGFRITFASHVCGPVALGYGAHYGLGLFRPEYMQQRKLADESKHGEGDFH
jgi:CRISPR-associated protein Csb2